MHKDFIIDLMSNSRNWFAKMKIMVKSTLCLFVVNASLVILLEAAIVQSARNTRSTEVLAQTGTLKAHQSDRLISPLCVENEMRPKIFR